MNSMFSKVALLTSVCLAPAAALVAQANSNTNTIVYGRSTLQLNSSFIQGLQGTGAVLTDLSGAPLANNSFVFKISGGVFSLQSLVGEVDHVGGIVATANGVSLRMQNPILDLTHPQTPVVTAVFVLNNVYVGRIALFNLQVAGGTALSPVENSAIQVSNFQTALAPAAAAYLSQNLGSTVPANTPIGTTSVYAVFAASANTDK